MLHFEPSRDLEYDVVVVVLVPGMLYKLKGAHPLLGLLDQQLGDKVLSVLRDVSLITGGEDKVTEHPTIRRILLYAAGS